MSVECSATRDIYSYPHSQNLGITVGKEVEKVRGGKDGVTGVFCILLDLCPHGLTGAVADFTGPSQVTFEKGEERSSGTPATMRRL